MTTKPGLPLDPTSFPQEPKWAPDGPTVVVNVDRSIITDNCLEKEFDANFVVLAFQHADVSEH